MVKEAAAPGYRVDGDGFLVDFADWDESFAESMAPAFGIAGGLTPKHWEVIHYIRRMFSEYGRCPLVYHTCKANGLRIRDLQTLFPSGYLRGACRLAGVTYKQGYHGSGSLPAAAARPAADRQPESAATAPAKSYTIDVHGFLVDPGQWDEAYAANRAAEMKVERLTDAHWKVLRFLRERHAASGVVPTIYETCASNDLELEDLERLFPDGYQRGAVKLAGLRVL
jgi:tRNA 2-thiouridine synthesizing protein E